MGEDLALKSILNKRRHEAALTVAYMGTHYRVTRISEELC